MGSGRIWKLGEDRATRWIRSFHYSMMSCLMFIQPGDWYVFFTRLLFIPNSIFM